MCLTWVVPTVELDSFHECSNYSFTMWDCCFTFPTCSRFNYLLFFFESEATSKVCLMSSHLSIVLALRVVDDNKVNIIPVEFTVAFQNQPNENNEWMILKSKVNKNYLRSCFKIETWLVAIFFCKLLPIQQNNEKIKIKQINSVLIIF